MNQDKNKEKAAGKRCKCRAPNAGKSCNARLVNPSGNVNNNNAINTNGAAPDCEKCQIKVAENVKSVRSRKECLSGSGVIPDENNYTDAAILRDSAAEDGIKDLVCRFENLYKAMNKCKRNVTWKNSVSNYLNNGVTKIADLRKRLLADSYKIKEYSVFEVHEKKTRTIVSTKFDDRVFQKSLCDNYLYNEITRGFIYDSHACQKKKGTDKARKRLKCHLQRFIRKHGLNGYVLKIDIHDFFGSTQHSVAKAAAEKRINDKWALEKVFEIIGSFERALNDGDKGMGLGSEITQLIQLAVLDDLDHEIKERLGIKCYIRYNDDMILIHESKEYLKECRRLIEERLNSMGLQFNEKKTYIQRLNKNIKFLGFSFKAKESGRITMKLLPKKAYKERKKIKKQAALYEKGILPKFRIRDSYRSWRANAKNGNSVLLVKKMDKFINSQLKENYKYD